MDSFAESKKWIVFNLVGCKCINFWLLNYSNTYWYTFRFIANRINKIIFKIKKLNPQLGMISSYFKSNTIRTIYIMVRWSILWWKMPVIWLRYMSMNLFTFRAIINSILPSFLLYL